MTNRQNHHFQIVENDYFVRSPSTMEDGMVLSGSTDGVIKLWSPDMKRFIKLFRKSPSFDCDHISNCDICSIKSTGGGRFVSVQSLGTTYTRIKKWNVYQSGESAVEELVLSRFFNSHKCMVLDSNAICSWAMGACNLWSLADGSLKKELRVNILHFVDLGIRLTDDGQQQRRWCNDRVGYQQLPSCYVVRAKTVYGEWL